MRPVQDRLCSRRPHAALLAVGAALAAPIPAQYGRGADLTPGTANITGLVGAFGEAVYFTYYSRSRRRAPGQRRRWFHPTAAPSLQVSNGLQLVIGAVAPH